MEFKLILVSALCLISVTSAWQLTGTDVDALAGTSTTIGCDITAPENYTGKLFPTWLNPDEKMIFFREEAIISNDRMVAVASESVMEVEITNVKLGDRGLYKCEMLGIENPVNGNVTLTVNQYPEVSVTKHDMTVKAGERATVATCVAKGSWPQPTMWFTDENGQKVDVEGDMQATDQGDDGFYTELSLTKTFTKSDHLSKYKCNVHLLDVSPFTADTEAVNVQYAATISYLELEDTFEVIEVGSSFEVHCRTDGNPAPTVTWTFTPDDNTNTSVSENQEIPGNFYVSGGKLMSSAVVLTDGVSTNNGTFTCTASNYIGAAAPRSFRMGVYVVPTTIAPTTTDLTPKVEARSAGSDAAVIGGVVAVAVFVLIVAIVLVVRYFTSHKGTYRTHEVKTQDPDGDRRDDVDDVNLMGDDDVDQELGGKKRTEYFM